MAKKQTMFDKLRAQFGEISEAVKAKSADISDEIRFRNQVQRELDKAKTQGRQITADERRSISKGFSLDELDRYQREGDERDAAMEVGGKDAWQAKAAEQSAARRAELEMERPVQASKRLPVHEIRDDEPRAKKGWKTIGEPDVHAALKRGKVKLGRELLDPNRLAVTNAYRAPKGLVYFVAVLDDEPKNATLYRYSVSSRRLKAQKSGARQRMFYALESLAGAL